MKKNKLIFLLLILICCRDNENFKTGILYVPLISFLPNKGLSKDKIAEVKKLCLKNKNNEHNGQEDSLKLFYKKLIFYKLLDKPHIIIKTQNNETLTIFLNKKEFKKIEKYLYINTYLKIQISLYAKKLNNDLYYSDCITNVKEIKK